MLAFYVDFNTLDNCSGGEPAVAIAHDDMNRARLAKAGTRIIVFCSQLVGEAILQPSDEANGWIGVIQGDWRDITPEEYERLKAISRSSRSE